MEIREQRERDEERRAINTSVIVHKPADESARGMQQECAPNSSGALVGFLISYCVDVDRVLRELSV